MHINQLPYKLRIATAAVKAHIDRHPLEWISIEEFARMQHVNRKDLQKCFKQQYGIKIHEYQMQKIMDAACAMLVEGKMTMKEIAAACGYSNQNNFSNAFKKMKDISPQAWQLTNGNNGFGE